MICKIECQPYLTMIEGKLTEAEYYYFRVLLGDSELANGFADTMQEACFKAELAMHDLKVLEPMCC
jgi:hypothetical protein